MIGQLAYLTWRGIRTLLFVVGTITILISMIGILRAPFVAREVANTILANAVPPKGREMPPTAHAISYTAADVQVLGGRGEGLSCSIPWIIEALAFPLVSKNEPIGLQMRQACASHDYCYRHGAATYGYSQADCDFLLQEHAFRLCIFIERGSDTAVLSEDDRSTCRSNARLVTLGVRAFGADSFRRVDAKPVRRDKAQLMRPEVDEAASTYFEFDPYPLRSGEFSAWRLADAPPSFDPKITKKALYTFEVRPSGTRVTVVGLPAAAEQKPQWVEHLLPGHHGFLNTAPLVTRNGGGEDWFVWFQRSGLETTEGRIAAIAPGRATPAEWQALFVKEAMEQRGCDLTIPHLIGGQRALVITHIGTRSCGEANLSELHSVPGLLFEENMLRLVALKTHSCVRSSNVLCVANISIDTTRGGQHQPQEPLRATDRFNLPRSGDAQQEQDRYRNFVSAPFALAAAGDPVVAWLRREKDYRGQAMLRRIATLRTEIGTLHTGRSVGSVRLEGFTEDDEPAFLIGRDNDNPRLGSMRSERSGQMVHSLRMRKWLLPPPSMERDDDADLSATGTAPCDTQLDASWHSRPPSLVALKGGQAILFLSRVEQTTADESNPRFVLQITALRLGTHGNCVVSDGVLVTSAPLEDITDQPEPASDWRKRLEDVRGQPLLVENTDSDGERFLLIVPRARAPGQSYTRTVLLRP